MPRKPKSEVSDNLTPPAENTTKPKRAPRPTKAVVAPEPVAEPRTKPGRGARTKATPVEPVVEPAPVAKSEPKPKAARPRIRTKPAAASSAADGDMLVPIWRPVAKTGSPEVESQEAATGPIAPRRSRKPRGAAAARPAVEEVADDPVPIDVAVQFRPTEERTESTRKRRRRGRRGSEEAVEVVAEKQSAPEPAQPALEAVPIPDDAPRIVEVHGQPVIYREGRIIPPQFFFGASLDGKRATNVLDEIRLATESGIDLFIHLVDLTVDLDSVDEAVSFAGYLLKKTVEINPNALVAFRMVFQAPKGWDRTYPNAKFTIETGGLAEPSVCDDSFWQLAEDCLADFIQKLRLLDTNRHVLGIHLERGEWFFADGWGYDTSIAAHDKFRQWVKMRYRDDIVALRAAWYDGSVQFQTVSVPEYGAEYRQGEQFVRMGRKARCWVDYHLFLSDTTVERIGKLANTVKRASEGYYLAGVSYGYTFEWSHPGSGHLSLGKLLRNRDVDFIAGPPSYKNREPGGTAAFPCPIDSFAINQKLYISEEDFKTPISGLQEPDDFNPVMKTPQALDSVHWRGAGAALAHSSGVCWMDLWGNGWLNTRGIWQRAAKIRQSMVNRLAVDPQEPDVAVFIDERSLAYLVDQTAFALLVQNVRESILRSGLSAGFYLLSDLAHRERFPESKLYVFMNAWDIRPEVRSAIKSRLQRDDKVLFWLYTAGLFDGGRDALERVREVTGIPLRKQPFGTKPGSTVLNRRNPLCEAVPEKLLASGGQLEPSYFAIPEESTVLAEYTQSGLPSFVIRDFHGDAGTWKSVFLGEPIVTPALFRALGQLAHAHVWSFMDDLVHVRPPFLTIHCNGTGNRTITLPNKWSAYNLVTEQWATVDSTHLSIQAIDGSTHHFLIGTQSDIEVILSQDPDVLQRMEEAPPKPDNTLSLDSIHFDVPIMKLDEWMEESWSEDLADDLLLKPSQFDFDLTPEDRTEKPRPKRNDRGRGRRRASAATPSKGIPSDEELEVNVVFRKRT